MLLLGAWCFTWLPPISGRPVFGFLAELALMLAGALVVPGALWLVCRLTRGPLARALRRWRLECQLAGANLSGAIPRIWISAAALAISLGMMIAISIMVSSFRDTVSYWLDSTLRADLWVKPTMLSSSVMEARMAPEAVATIQNDPDVTSTSWYSARQVPYGDTTIRLVTTDLGQLLEHGRLLFKSPARAPEAVRRGLASDGVLLSESMALKYHKQPGDQVELPTAQGRQCFPVLAVYYDYASNQGTVMMDTASYARHFTPTES